MKHQSHFNALQNIGEDQTIRTLIKQLPCGSNVQLGAGDDCAVFIPKASSILLKTDTVIEGVHYLAEEKPQRVGWKAVARVVSDFAAMGGRPDALVIALACKPETHLTYLEQLYEGMCRCAKRYDCSIVGGETSSAAQNVITVSGTGTCEKVITRSGGKPKDKLYVTGTLGGSILGKHLDFLPRVEEAQWIVKNLQPSAMMDLSDGLGKDLPRLAVSSRTGYFLDKNALPLSKNCTVQQAIADGEDYELLFASPHTLTTEQHQQWNALFPETPLTWIGSLTEKAKKLKKSETAEEISSQNTPLSGGWEHFTATNEH